LRKKQTDEPRDGKTGKPRRDVLKKKLTGNSEMARQEN
jgi:hypothetical protein